jgi:hypothetical protein
MKNNIAVNYVDKALEKLSFNGLMHHPSKPPKPMRDPSTPRKGDWYPWIDIPSTVTDIDLNELEKEIGLWYPPLYRDFLKYKHFIDLTEDGIRFPQHLPNLWNEKLKELYHASWVPERIIGIGLLPFGSESLLDAGPVCFDTRNQLPRGDYPVVFWDHEWVESEKEIRLLFSSSQKMFECLYFAASQEINFFCQNIDDSDEIRSKKHNLIEQFIAIGRSGAGGPGAEYWKSMIIK